jgi:HEAT repeat protein
VRAAAAQSLGTVGTVRAVPPLRDAESTGDRAVRRAARAAIASIQSRLVGAGRGQLAVASDAGELTLADDTAGRVALEDES